MKRLPLLISVVLMLSCSACGTKTVDVRARFNASDAQYISQNGRNKIEILGFVRIPSGGISLCSDFPVELWPVTDFSRELVKGIAGSENGGEYVYFIHPLYGMEITESLEYRRFREYVMASPCDADGRAAFAGVPDGEYYVYLYMTWNDLGPSILPGILPGNIPMAGHIVDRVRVAGGQTLQHTLSRAQDDSAPYYKKSRVIPD
ncbi:MAG: hypothetical protein LBR80_13915 [Deltaproteobacteria bacterium]|jgi:hypothetical protein|nr:hypothetical protein [Deltaproteobacteria bacterium]